VEPGHPWGRAEKLKAGGIEDQENWKPGGDKRAGSRKSEIERKGGESYKNRNWESAKLGGMPTAEK
jgi:hypothetical protein